MMRWYSDPRQGGDGSMAVAALSRSGVSYCIAQENGGVEGALILTLGDSGD